MFLCFWLISANLLTCLSNTQNPVCCSCHRNCKSCLQTVGLVWRLGMQASVVDATDTRDFTIFGEHAANILGYSEKEIGSLKQNDPVQYKALLQVRVLNHLKAHHPDLQSRHRPNLWYIQGPWTWFHFDVSTWALFYRRHRDPSNVVYWDMHTVFAHHFCKSAHLCTADSRSLNDTTTHKSRQSTN